MYRKKDRMGQREIKYICLEDLIPQDHLLRKIEASISFDFIYDEVKGMYPEIEWGKPGIDPVTLFKIVFLQYLYGIRSMRQTIREIEVNNAYRPKAIRISWTRRLTKTGRHMVRSHLTEMIIQMMTAHRPPRNADCSTKGSMSSNSPI